MGGSRKPHMAQFVNTISQKSGIRPERAQKGLEALLLTIRDRLSEESFGEILNLLPEAREMPTLSSARIQPQLDFWGSTLAGPRPAYPQTQEAPLTSLLTHLARAGISLHEAKRFLPTTLQLLRRQLPPGLMRQVELSVPGLSNFAALQTPGFLDRIRGLF